MLSPTLLIGLMDSVLLCTLSRMNMEYPDAGIAFLSHWV